MKVKKTLFQIMKEINELKELKESTGRMVANSLIRENDRCNDLLEEYRHYDEYLKYLYKIEVEFEDKYETEEEED